MPTINDMILTRIDAEATMWHSEAKNDETQGQKKDIPIEGKSKGGV
jgi:hypothetical protein